MDWKLFFKYNKRKLFFVIILLIISYFFGSYSLNYSLGWSANPNILFLNLILQGPVLLLTSTIVTFRFHFILLIFAELVFLALRIAWLYALSSICNYYYEKNKFYTIGVVIIVLIIAIILSFNIFHHSFDSDKDAFVTALKNENVSDCLEISSLANVDGAELIRLIDESGFNTDLNFLHYIDGYSLRYSCEQIFNISNMLAELDAQWAEINETS